MGSCMNGASVTSRSTGIFCFSSERAISITLFAPCEWPTRTSGPVLPAARSRTISLSAVDQYKWPATWALMPLALSSSARPSMPVENTPNQPRSRSTRGSPAKAGLQHSSAMAAARHLAPSSERNAWRWFCARDGASLPRYPRPIRAIISATAPCCVTAETPFGVDGCFASPFLDPLPRVDFFRIIARLRLDTRTQQIRMPLVLLLPLVSLVIYLVPIMILRRKAYARAQDYFISSERSPPGVILNSSVAYALKMATFGPFFVWGASGDFWPAITYSAFFAFGVCLIYILRRPMLEFMENALNGDGSVTVHDFIARQHGNDARVRLLACALTVFAVLVLVTGEALVLATFLKPVFSDDALWADIFVCAIVIFVALYTVLSGNSGVMRSAQSQLGFLYLGLFGATALLLYLLISAQPPMTPHSTFAFVFVAACCVAVALYRRSRYIDTSPIRNRDTEGHESGPESKGARLFRRFEKILNVCVSVCAAWVIVVAGMELYSEGLAAIARD